MSATILKLLFAREKLSMATYFTRSHTQTTWHYLGMAATLFIVLFATGCSGGSEEPKGAEETKETEETVDMTKREPPCHGKDQLKNVTPADEPVALAGSYERIDGRFTISMTFSNGNVNFIFGVGSGFESPHTGRYKYTEMKGGRWPFIALNASLRREAGSEVSRVQIYRLEYDSCHSELFGRPTELAWLADGRILVGSNDARGRITHYYSFGDTLTTFSGATTTTFICQPSATSACNTFASMLPPVVTVPDTIRDMTEGIAAGSARVFSKGSERLLFRPDNTFSYEHTRYNDWATGGTWERVQKSGEDHFRVFIPADLRATVSGGAESMFAQIYKITWDRPASTRNPPLNRPGEVLWFTNNDALISEIQPSLSAFTVTGISFSGHDLRGAEYLIPQTSPSPQ